MSASGTVMPATQHGYFNLSTELSPAAQSAFVLDDLQTGTLISLAQLCDDDCIAIFTKYDVKIIKNNKIIITGKREDNGLWSVPITTPATSHLTSPTLIHQANGILRTDKTQQELAQYLHVTFGSPPSSIFLRAIRRGHVISVPGLNTKLISKHLPKSIATALGHQDQEGKGLRSTKKSSQTIQVTNSVTAGHQITETPET